MSSSSPQSRDRAGADELTRPQALRLGLGRSLPIVLGYAPVGFAFGVLAVQNGMPISLATAMSILMFAGSGQFIAISMWFSGAGLLSTAIAVFVTNLRYLLMSVALAPHVTSLKGLSRLVFGWHVTDELFAVHIAAFHQGWKPDRLAIFSATTSAQASWVLSTLAGALCGSVVTDVKPLGLDYALSAMFLALLVPQCTDRLHVFMALLAAFFSVSLRLAGLGAWNVVLATILAATIGTLLHRQGRKTAGGDDRDENTHIDGQQGLSAGEERA